MLNVHTVEQYSKTRKKSQNHQPEDRPEVDLRVAHQEAARRVAHHAQDHPVAHREEVLRKVRGEALQEAPAVHQVDHQKGQAERHPVQSQMVGLHAVRLKDRHEVLRQGVQKVVLRRALNVDHQNE